MAIESKAAGKATAILVIHGGGAHERFQRLDDFVRGFKISYEKRWPKDVTLQHGLKPRPERLQSCVSIASTSGKKADCYEYFWDGDMVHQALPDEALKFLGTARKNTQKYPPSSVDRLKSTQPKPGLFHALVKWSQPIRWIAKFFLWTLIAALVVLGVLLVGEVFGFGFVKTITKAVAQQLKWIYILSAICLGLYLIIIKSKILAWVLDAAWGDLVRYFDLDPRSTHYETRNKIQKGAVKELRTLMTDDDYDEIIIVGHSLGSVIGYDAINRLSLEMTAEKTKTELEKDKLELDKQAKKLVGFVTFGSPLDMVACYFMETATNPIWYDLLADRHSFKTEVLKKIGSKRPAELKDPENLFRFHAVRWLNFYHPDDVVGGRLDLYDLDFKDPNGDIIKDSNGDPMNGNIRIDKEKVAKGKTPHNCYWNKDKKGGTQEVQDKIVEVFFNEAN